MAAWKTIIALLLASVLLVDADEEGGAVFGYGGSNGPDKWGSLSPAYQLCSKGGHQSPININTSELVNNTRLKPLQEHYFPAHATLVNKRYQVGLLFDQNVGFVIVDGREYRLKSVHWHSPSEHTIDGKRFSAEVHIVHTGNDGSITVTAILYDIGHHDPLLVQIGEKLKELAEKDRGGDKGASIPVGVVHVRSLRRIGGEYYRYLGSLTTPPCTENVIWSVIVEAREMSEEQLAALQAPLNQENRSNSRPTQPLNHREVQFYNE